MTEIISILGVVFSFAGAYYAWHHAKKAKEYSKQAEGQIADRRSVSDLSQLMVRWETLYEALATFGPAARLSDIRGQNPAITARKAQDYIEEVMRCKSSLGSILNLENRLQIINKIINEFSSARKGSELKDKGSELLGKLSDLNASILSILVAKQETVNLT